MCVCFSFQHTNTLIGELKGQRARSVGRSVCLSVCRSVREVQPLIRTVSSEMSPHTHTHRLTVRPSRHTHSLTSQCGYYSTVKNAKCKKKSENDRRLESEMIDQASPASLTPVGTEATHADVSDRNIWTQTSDLITCRQSILQIWFERRHRFAEFFIAKQLKTPLMGQSRSRLWYQAHISSTSPKCCWNLI